jgi:DNA-binding NarL/FixJ family response regulator
MTDTADRRIRVLIADDHPIFRKGLREVVEEDPQLVVVGEAADGEAALKCLESLDPQVAVIDIDMPKMNGFAIAEVARDRGLRAGLVFLTMLREEDAFNRALDVGVKGYVLKDCAVLEIVSGIKAVAEGQHYLSPSISSFLIRRSARRNDFSRKTPGIEQLTPTERRVLTMIAEKKTSKEISAELFISPRTVDNHRNNICTKLDLHGSNALLKFALEHKSELL